MKQNGLDFKRGKSNIGNVVLDTLVNHGIDNLEEFKEIDMTNVPFLNPSMLSNIDLAYDRVNKALINHEKIGIVVDGDADGFASAALLYKALYDLSGDNVHLYTAGVKSHGLSPIFEGLVNENFDVIITPDSSSNDDFFHEKFKKLGTDIIVLDHHIIDNNEEALESPAIIVNNQNNDNSDTNENYVGVGMVYLFLRYMNEKNGDMDLDSFLPLFALGQITDMSDISDPEIKAQVDKGLSLFKEHLLFQQFVGDITPSSHKVSFEIAPKINAVARVGSLEDRYNLLYALAETLDENETDVFVKNRKNKVTGEMESHPVTLTKYQQEHDALLKIKGKQDRLVKKVVENLEYISHKEDGLVIAKIENDTPSSITGLLANRIISKTQTPAMVIKEFGKDSGSYIGSMRCPKNFEFRTWLNETGFVLSSGHEQAAGVEGYFDNIESLLESANDLDISQNYYDVDEIYNEYTADIKPVEDINKQIGLFGGAIKEPVLGFKSIPINKSHIHVRKSVITFTYNKINFIMFNGASFVDWLMDSGFQSTFYFDIVGSAGENTWNNKTTPQVIIKDIAVTKKARVQIEKPEDMVF